MACCCEAEGAVDGGEDGEAGDAVTGGGVHLLVDLWTVGS